MEIPQNDRKWEKILSKRNYRLYEIIKMSVFFNEIGSLQCPSDLCFPFGIKSFFIIIFSTLGSVVNAIMEIIETFHIDYCNITIFFEVTNPCFMSISSNHCFMLILRFIWIWVSFVWTELDQYFEYGHYTLILRPISFCVWLIVRTFDKSMSLSSCRRFVQRT